MDVAAFARIRDEAMNRSQVMDTVFWLTDRYGPRLTGSPEFEEAADWTIRRLESWGVRNVTRERFSSGYGWSVVRFHTSMVEPRFASMIAVPRAWSPGLGDRTVVADVVRPSIVSAADADRYRGKLRGKIVLTQPSRIVRMLEYGDGEVVRYDDEGGKWRAEAMTPEPPRVVAGRGAGAGTGGRGRGEAPFDVMAFYKQEGVVALFDRGASGDVVRGGSNLSWAFQRVDGGTIFTDDGVPSRTRPDASLPQVTLAVEHYNRLVRLLDHQVPVKVELQLDVRFVEESEARPNSFNIVGEIPGREQPGEVVMIGAHFDSFHGGTGATDNAAGVAAAMEVLRIFQATGLRPRRTVRIGLWGNEEFGLVGSGEYVRRHLGTAARPLPEHGRLSVYFNLDNGTGPIRGVWSQGNDAARQVFQEWAKPLEDLGVDLLSPRAVGSTDHVPFDAAGIPAFQFVQERYEYYSRTHHSTMDVFDRVQPNDMKQIAAVAAAFVWQAANRRELMPRIASAPEAR